MRHARQLAWSQLELHVLIRDQIVYAYFNTPNAPGIEAFRLLDRANDLRDRRQPSPDVFVFGAGQVRATLGG